MAISFEIALVAMNGKKDSPLKGDYSILSCSVTCAVNKLPRARVVIQEKEAHLGKFEVATAAELKLGTPLGIKLTNVQDLSPLLLFQGVVEKMTLVESSAGPSVELELCHAALRMTKQCNTRVFKEGSSDLSAVKELLDAWGKDGGNPVLESLPPDLPTTVFKNLVQHEVTDWDFICWRASVNGRLVTFTENKLEVFSPALGGTKAVVQLGESPVLDYEIKVDGSQYLESITNIDQDVSAVPTAVKKAKSVKAGLVPTSVKAGGLGKAMGTQALEFLQPIPGEKPETDMYGLAVHARAELSLVRGKVKLFGDAKLAPLTPGQVIQMKQFGLLKADAVMISSIHHRFGSQGWTVEIEFGLDAAWYAEQRQLQTTPALGLLPAVSGLQLAEVLDTQKVPDADGRILVQPLTQNEPKVGAKKAMKGTVLARLMSFYAGEKRGAWFRPEKGDLVVLGFLNDDPRHPVILGSVYRNNQNLPLEVEATNKLKGLLFDEKMGLTYDSVGKVITLSTQVDGALQTILLDHTNNQIAIQHTDDHSIVLSNDGIVVNTKGDLKITATGELSLSSEKKVDIKGPEINLLN